MINIIKDETGVAVLAETGQEILSNNSYTEYKILNKDFSTANQVTVYFKINEMWEFGGSNPPFDNVRAGRNLLNTGYVTDTTETGCINQIKTITASYSSYSTGGMLETQL